MTDGRYAVSESLLNEPKLFPKRDVLLAGSVETLTSANFVEDSRTGAIIGGNPYALAIPRTPWAFTQIAEDVDRFELRQGDQGFVPETSPWRLHRAEVISTDVPPFGTELWQACSVMLEAGNPFTTDGQCYANQWHGYDPDVGYGKSPPLCFDYGNNKLRIISRSDADINPTTLSGVDVVHYDVASPTRGVYNDFVLNIIFARSGKLKVWLNGSLIVDHSGPIGYYNDTNGSYQQHGIYARQAPDVPGSGSPT